MPPAARGYPPTRRGSRPPAAPPPQVACARPARLGGCGAGSGLPPRQGTVPCLPDISPPEDDRPEAITKPGKAGWLPCLRRGYPAVAAGYPASLPAPRLPSLRQLPCLRTRVTRPAPGPDGEGTPAPPAHNATQRTARHAAPGGRLRACSSLRPPRPVSAHLLVTLPSPWLGPLRLRLPPPLPPRPLHRRPPRPLGGPRPGPPPSPSAGLPPDLPTSPGPPSQPAPIRRHAQRPARRLGRVPGGTNLDDVGLASVYRNNKATLPLTAPSRAIKSSAKDLSPPIVKLSSDGKDPCARPPGVPLPSSFDPGPCSGLFACNYDGRG